MAWCPGPANSYTPFGWADLPIPLPDWAAENRWSRTRWSNLIRVRWPIPPSTPHLLCHRIGIELLGIKQSPPLQALFVFLVLGIANGLQILNVTVCAPTSSGGRLVRLPGTRDSGLLSRPAGNPRKEYRAPSRHQNHIRSFDCSD